MNGEKRSQLLSLRERAQRVYRDACLDPLQYEVAALARDIIDYTDAVQTSSNTCKFCGSPRVSVCEQKSLFGDGDWVPVVVCSACGRTADVQ